MQKDDNPQDPEQMRETYLEIATNLVNAAEEIGLFSCIVMYSVDGRYSVRIAGDVRHLHYYLGIVQRKLVDSGVENTSWRRGEGQPPSAVSGGIN